MFVGALIFGISFFISIIKYFARSFNLFHPFFPLRDRLGIENARGFILTWRFVAAIPYISNVLSNLVLTFELRPLNQGTRLLYKVLQAQIALLQHF